MVKDNKYGSISGVFTPSILTILGVIMYMRLGWIIGQAGLITTIVIILLAHIISITTGLSISSIATDKKIKAGGIYYILSRSMGLPMGGSIGIALTIGTALSISLYIVGFSESFLSIKAISEFLNLVPSVEAYRIVGSVVLIILVIIALISTSLAIKTQYIILGAIVLSLVSIFVGFGINVELRPDSPVFSAFSDGVPLETVFAVFFPAVTGFTAGVAMSGDLRNPKKNIPVGTLLSISVGFVIYIALTIGFAFFVSRDNLLNDGNIAVNVAWIPSLVFAGIWGATISSALGGILGGPRILQALGKDKVVPKFLAKGYTESNEPRNALLFIFIIAEAGILIGDLNVIAGVVTMFYLASYGFINLAYVLESWASTDFRPSFKVSYVFGLVGFVFAFAIMFKLDVLSMIVAFIIIGFIYFILQRKQLRFDYGDVWQSVWFSVIKRGLNALDGKTLYDHNWQPNMILFSGGTDKRKYLLEFGKSIVGKFGLLTNFDLHVDKNAKVLFPKYKQSVQTKETQESGIFLRRQTCKNIYDGIEMIVRTYGFSGLEPNTAMLGWARQSKNPKHFVKLLQTINNLDLNLILIDYDTRIKYGKYSQIDIWWRGAGNNGNFALTIGKFLSESEKWENAKIRLMIVNNDDSKAYYLYRRANEVLDSMRFNAEVKIINNELEKLSFYDIVKLQSKNADVVFIGIPYIVKGKEKDFVNRTNKLLFEIGTVVLIQAASLFKEINLGVNLHQKTVLSSSDEEDNYSTEALVEKLFESKHKKLYDRVSANLDSINKIYDKTIQTFVFKEVDDFTIFLNDFEKLLLPILNLFKNNLHKFRSYSERKNYVYKYQKYLIQKLARVSYNFKEKYYNELQELMKVVVAEYFMLQKEYFADIQDNIYLHFDKKDLTINKDDLFWKKLHKTKLKFFNSNKDVVDIVFSAKQRKRNIRYSLIEILLVDIEKIRIETLRFIYNYQEVFHEIIAQIDNLKIVNNSKIKISKNILNIELVAKNGKERLEKLLATSNSRTSGNRKKLLLKTLNNFLINAESYDTFYDLKNDKSHSKQEKIMSENINFAIKIFFSSFESFLNQVDIQNKIELFKYTTVDQIFVLIKFINSKSSDIVEIDSFIDVYSQVKSNLKAIIDQFEEIVEIMDEASFNDSFYKDLKRIKTLKFYMRGNMNKYVEKNVFAKILEIIDSIVIIDKDEAVKIIEGLNKIIYEIKNLNIYKLNQDNKID